MKKSKVNYELLCKAYNEARQQNVGRKMISNQLITLFQKEGISKWIINKMLQVPTLFTKVKREGRGRCIGYMFPYTPVNIHWFENWLKNQKSTSSKKVEKKALSFEEECVQYLKENGYSLKKCVGFDEAAFSKDYPELYQKYLRYDKI